MTPSELIRWAVTHQQDHPNHGLNCICADEQIRKLRTALIIAPSVTRKSLSQEDSDFVTSAQARVNYIVASVVD